MSEGVVGQVTQVPHTRTRVRPLGDRVIVMEVPMDQQTASGIFLPDNARESSQRGVIVSVGAGPRSPFTGEIAKMGLEPGMEVMYAQHTGQELMIDGIPALVLRENEIICVIERGDAEGSDDDPSKPNE